MPNAMKRGAPFLRTGTNMQVIVLWMFSCLAVLASLYSVFYDPVFILRFIGFSALGFAMETLYYLLAEGRFRFVSASSAVTAGLLLLSIPARMPLMPIVFSLAFALFFAKMPVSENAIHFNPMLVARLFLMLAFSPNVNDWRLDGMADAVTCATPLQLFHNEGATYELLRILVGRIGGNWEGLYEIVPCSPGEMFTPFIALAGVLLSIKGVLKWQTGASFLIAFCITTFVVGSPVVFSVLTGSVVFASVFIAGDYKTTPMSKSGRIFAGVIAGAADALIRKYTIYAEGIVFSFLLVNLVSPTLDRIAFYARARRAGGGTSRPSTP
jgi:electron transport complex protein RnfD